MRKFILFIAVWVCSTITVYAQDYAVLEGQMVKGKMSYRFDGENVSSPDLITVLHNKKKELKVSADNRLDLIIIIDSNITLEIIDNLNGLISKVGRCNTYYLVRFTQGGRLSELFVQYGDSMDRKTLDKFIKQKRQQLSEQITNN